MSGNTASIKPPSARSAGLATAVKLLVTLVFIALVLVSVDLDGVGRLIMSADLRLLALAVVVLVIDRLLQAGKWYPLLRVQVPSIPLARAVRAYLASYAASFVMPASVGGDVLRAVALGRSRRVIAEIGASIIAERLLGLTTLVILCFFALLYGIYAAMPLEFLLPWTIAAAVAGALVFALPFNRTVARRISRVLEKHRHRYGVGGLLKFGAAYAAYRSHRGLLAVIALLCFVEHGVIIAIMWIVSLALGTSITLPMLLVAVPVTLFMYRIPITYWGLGIAEGALVYMLGLFAVPAAEALSLSLMFRTVELCVALPGALLWTDLVRPDAEGIDCLAGGTPLEEPVERAGGETPGIQVAG